MHWAYLTENIFMMAKVDFYPKYHPGSTLSLTRSKCWFPCTLVEPREVQREGKWHSHNSQLRELSHGEAQRLFQNRCLSVLSRGHPCYLPSLTALLCEGFVRNRIRTSWQIWVCPWHTIHSSLMGVSQRNIPDEGLLLVGPWVVLLMTSMHSIVLDGCT